MPAAKCAKHQAVSALAADAEQSKYSKMKRNVNNGDCGGSWRAKWRGMRRVLVATRLVIIESVKHLSKSTASSAKWRNDNFCEYRDVRKTAGGGALRDAAK
jgi:hypothetical protein